MSIEASARPPRDADATTVLAPHAGARGLVLLGIHEHHVRDVDRALALDHAAAALLARALRRRLLDGRDDRVADTRVAPARPAADADAEDLARARVVGHAQACLVLDHRARSSTSTRRQRFVRDSGLLSTTRTV